MPTPKKWTIEDIIELRYFKKIPVPYIRDVVEKFPSKEAFQRSNAALKYYANIDQGRIFDGTVQDIRTAVEKQIETCLKNNFKIVSFWDDNYPELLRDITHPPVLLFVWGALQQADAASISIVGTRRCTTYGKISAELFAEVFARNRIIVTSGLAFGIDTASQLAAVRAGGVSYAVVASGLDCIKPFLSHKNAEKIVDGGGAIISDYMCGTRALPAYFPQRNRIISGISKAVIIVESAIKGGSLITARFALDQGRDVFAVPGRISSEKSAGANTLIKKNQAALALSPESVLEDLGFISPVLDFGKEAAAPKFKTKEEELIYNAIDDDPAHVDELSDRTGIETPELLVKLLEMEFSGVLKQLPGKHYLRAR